MELFQTAEAAYVLAAIVIISLVYSGYAVWRG